MTGQLTEAPLPRKETRTPGFPLAVEPSMCSLGTRLHRRLIGRNICFSILVAFCFLSLGITQNRALSETIFPFYVEMGTPISLGLFDSYRTSFSIVNPNSESAEVTFHFFDPAGKELFRTTSGAAETVMVGGRSLKGFAVQWPENLIAWVRATSSEPVIIQEVIIHGRELRSPGEPTGVTVKSEIRKPPSPATRREMIWVNYFFFQGATFFQDTGISIVFPSRGALTPAQGTLILRNFQGQKIGERSVSIGPNAQLARPVSELFPEIAQNVSLEDFLRSCSIRTYFSPQSK